MIQESINQLLGTVGIGARLNPSYENRQAAKNFYSKGVSAETGLKDIESVLDRASAPGGTPLSQYELRDIEERVGEHVHNIGSLKTAAIPGQTTARYIPTELDPETGRTRIKGMAPREEYSRRLDSISGKLSAMKEKAIQSMQEKGQSALEQDKAFSEHKDTVFRNRYSSPQEAISAAKLRSEKLDKLRASAIEGGK